MTGPQDEVLGSGDETARRPWIVVLIVFLVVGSIVTVVARGGTHRTASPPPPAPLPTQPLVSIVPESGVLPASLGHVGNLAISLGHTTHTPVYGTVTTLDGPPATSPITFETKQGVPVGVVGTGDTMWLAEVRTVPEPDAGPGALEGFTTSGGTVGGAPLPDVPHSIALVAGKVWVGLDGRVVEYDPQTNRSTLHRVSPGVVVDLVADPNGRYLYGAQSDGSSIVRWRLPGLVEEVARAVPGGMHVTHLAYWLGELWASTADETVHRGRVLRIQPDTLGDLNAGPLTRQSAVQGVYASSGELWILAADERRLRCVRPTTTGLRLGPSIALQPLGPAESTTDLLVAVGQRVYVQVQNGPVTYERSVSCPAA